LVPAAAIWGVRQREENGQRFFLHVCATLWDSSNSIAHLKLKLHWAGKPQKRKSRQGGRGADFHESGMRGPCKIERACMVALFHFSQLGHEA